MTFPSALDPIRSLQAAWKLLVRAPAPLLVGGVLLTLFEGGPWAFVGVDKPHPERVVAAVIGFGCCCGVVSLLVSSWIELGLARSVDEVQHTGCCDLSTLWNTHGRYVDMVLARLLALGVVIAALVPAGIVALGAALGQKLLHVDDGLVALFAILGWLVYLPVFLYIVLGLSWVSQAVAIEGHGAVAALKRSWQLASGTRIALAVYWLTLIVFAHLGICCFCVLYFLTSPLTYVSRTEAFLRLTRDEARPNPEAANVSAPPPLPN